MLNLKISNDFTKRKCLCLAIFIAILLDSDNIEKIDGFLNAIQSICSDNEDRYDEYIKMIKSFSYHASREEWTLLILIIFVF